MLVQCRQRAASSIIRRSALLTGASASSSTIASASALRSAFFPSASSISSSSCLHLRQFHTSLAHLREQFNKDKANLKKKKEKAAEAKKKSGAMKDKADNSSAGDEVGISVSAMEAEMEEYLERMRAAFAQIKVGRALPTSLDSILIQAHGQMIPLKGLASISSKSAQVLLIQLYDPSISKEVDKAIRTYNNTLNPTMEPDGSGIAVTFPKVTKEVRDGLVKQVSKKAEETRGHLRTIRQNYLQSLKSIEKSGEISEELLRDLKGQIQTSHDVLVGEIKKLQDEKDKEIQIV